MSDTTSGFSADERAAMKQRAEELKAMKGVKGSAKKAKEFEACVAAIDALDGVDRAVAERLHVIVMEEAPHLDPMSNRISTCTSSSAAECSGVPTCFSVSISDPIPTMCGITRE